MQVIIKLENDIEIEEMRKTISFISEEIISYEIENSNLKLVLKENANVNEIIRTVQDISKKYRISNNQRHNLEFVNNIYNRLYYENIIEDEKLFYKMGDGLIELRGKSIFLYEFFDTQFRNMAINFGAVLKMYPVLLPVSEYRKTGYLHNSPQYAMFCGSVHENIKELENLELYIDNNDIKSLMNSPSVALSPSACFHTYIEFKNKTLERNSVITFNQSVFRNEGRFNYYEIGRLKDYHVREIVFLGDNNFVCDMRRKVIEKIKEFMNQWRLQGNIQVAVDPFVLPKMQKYKRIQLIDKSKYEVRLNVGESKTIAVGSFNLHGTAFTYPFNISIKDCEIPVTGCVGFGIERWVIAFLSQYGYEEEKWPECFYKAYCNYKM